MRVKIKGPVALRLKSGKGRPFHCKHACEVDLDKLGYSEKEQKELLENDAIEEMKASSSKKGS